MANGTFTGGVASSSVMIALLGLATGLFGVDNAGPGVDARWGVATGGHRL